MKKELVSISKIKYNPINKNYKLMLNSLESNKKLSFYVSNKDAKNIAMSKENIYSKSLSVYNLFINLLDTLKIKITFIDIKKNIKNNLLCIINMKSINDNKRIKIYSSLTDSFILALKSLSNIYIESRLLTADKNNSNNKLLINSINSEDLDHINVNNTPTIKSKIKMLKIALDDSINNENYESAAFLRDRIKKLNNLK